MKYKLGILGAGNMAEAIVRSALTHGLMMADQVVAADPSPQRREIFASLGVAVTDSNEEVITGAKQIMLAVKPQMISEIGPQLEALQADKQIILSIMAGITSTKIEEAVGGTPLRIVRIMPNTPLMVGTGMTGIALGEHARQTDGDFSLRLFGAAGEAIMVAESDIDAITAVSGSGPAYLFYLAEAMEQAAENLGLTQHAQLLARQTLLGAAKLLCESEDSAAQLRRKVSSPGGTTEAAINHMEEQSVRSSIVDAMAAAHARSLELGS